MIYVIYDTIRIKRLKSNINRTKDADKELFMNDYYAASSAYGSSVKRRFLRLPWLKFQSYKYSDNAGYILIDNFFIVYSRNRCDDHNVHPDPDFRFRCGDDNVNTSRFQSRSSNRMTDVPRIFRKWLAGMATGGRKSEHQRNPYIGGTGSREGTSIEIGKPTYRRVHNYYFIIWGYLDEDVLKEKREKNGEQPQGDWAPEDTSKAIRIFF